MRLTIVGSAPAYTSRSGHASSCYFVEHDSTGIALDFGQGSFSELWRYCSPAELDAVFISHLHADHCADLIPLRHWVRYENGGRGPALFGPAELGSRFDAFQATEGFLSDLGGEALEEQAFMVGGLAVEARRVTHIPDSFAFRVTVAGMNRPGLVYSGDCSVADDLLPLVQPGDLLLCEAALGAGPPDGGPHLTAEQAAGIAARGRAGSLLLTHVLDSRDSTESLAAARSTFDGPAELAAPGMSIDIR